MKSHVNHSVISRHTSQPEREPSLTLYGAHDHISNPSNHSAIFLLPRQVHRWRALGRVLRLEIGSLFGRIQTLISKKQFGLDLGLLWSRLPDGCLTLNVRTASRSEDISRLEFRYPWASSMDVQIFLEGWKAGEEFALRTRSKSESAPEETLSPHTSIQQSNAKSGHISAETPAPIAGVTKSVK
jgi:hypothetical protein